MCVVTFTWCCVNSLARLSYKTLMRHEHYTHSTDDSFDSALVPTSSTYSNIFLFISHLTMEIVESKKNVSLE